MITISNFDYFRNTRQQSMTEEGDRSMLTPKTFCISGSEITCGPGSARLRLTVNFASKKKKCTKKDRSAIIDYFLSYSCWASRHRLAAVASHMAGKLSITQYIP
jgi:hypothetical protein